MLEHANKINLQIPFSRWKQLAADHETFLNTDGIRAAAAKHSLEFTVSALTDEEREIDSATEILRHKLAELYNARRVLADIKAGLRPGIPCPALPDDIWRLIFGLLIERPCNIDDFDRGPSALARVCRSWRSVAVQSPEMWDNLVLKYEPPQIPSPDQALGAASQQMSRSSSLLSVADTVASRADSPPPADPPPAVTATNSRAPRAIFTALTFCRPRLASVVYEPPDVLPQLEHILTLGRQIRSLTIPATPSIFARMSTNNNFVNLSSLTVTPSSSTTTAEPFSDVLHHLPALTYLRFKGFEDSRGPLPSFPAGQLTHLISDQCESHSRGHRAPPYHDFIAKTPSLTYLDILQSDIPPTSSVTTLSSAKLYHLGASDVNLLNRFTSLPALKELRLSSGIYTDEVDYLPIARRLMTFGSGLTSLTLGNFRFPEMQVDFEEELPGILTHCQETLVHFKLGFTDGNLRVIESSLFKLYADPWFQFGTTPTDGTPPKRFELDFDIFRSIDIVNQSGDWFSCVKPLLAFVRAQTLALNVFAFTPRRSDLLEFGLTDTELEELATLKSRGEIDLVLESKIGYEDYVIDYIRPRSSPEAIWISPRVALDRRIRFGYDEPNPLQRTKTFLS